MNYLGPILIAIGIATGIYSFVGQSNFKDDIIEFESRCDKKGGVTLQAYRHGKQWIGCYKNVEEIENETAQ
uniref:Phage protein n=1 Tax=Pseudomonas phage Arace01 TaxID=3138526 RepID=A0AAU6VZ36_9VIRU